MSILKDSVEFLSRGRKFLEEVKQGKKIVFSGKEQLIPVDVGGVFYDVEVKGLHAEGVVGKKFTTTVEFVVIVNGKRFYSYAEVSGFYDEVEEIVKRETKKK